MAVASQSSEWLFCINQSARVAEPSHVYPHTVRLLHRYESLTVRGNTRGVPRDPGDAPAQNACVQQAKHLYHSPSKQYQMTGTVIDLPSHPVLISKSGV